MFLQYTGGLTSLALRLRFNYNSIQIRKALLDSQYHTQGLTNFKSAVNAKKMLMTYDKSLLKIQQQLELARKHVLKSGTQLKHGQLVQPEDLKAKNYVEEYFKRYERLVEQVDKIPLSSEWIYRIIGWYNIIPQYKTILINLLSTEREEQMLALVEILSQMSYIWENPYGIIDQDLFKKELISNFYKRLTSYDLDLSTLKKIEKILPIPVNFLKRKFYASYVRNNIDNLLKYLQVDDRYTISDLIWLMHTYIKNMNDTDQWLNSIQKYLITSRPTLSKQDMARLMDSYQLKGKINKNIYENILKPYIIRNKMGSLENLIDMVKFNICSQCQDNNLLKQLFELIAIKYKQQKISSSKHAYTLHLYCHYLMIKGYRIELPPALKKQLTIFCKQRSQGRSNIHHLLAKPGNQKYFSPCLEGNQKIIPEFQPTKSSVFQSLFGSRLRSLKLTQYQIYQKPVCCCFELDYLLSHKSRQQLIDIQIEGIQYVFTSGRLIREREIRDELLEHYGIKINHLDYNSLKGLAGVDEDELLNNRKLK